MGRLFGAIVHVAVYGTGTIVMALVSAACVLVPAYLAFWPRH